MNKIDLDSVAGSGRTRNLSGKERGIAARKQLKLDAIDAQPGEVLVVVPDYVDTISPSFFQGLFSQSIRTLKGKDRFLIKYRFDANDSTQRWIEVGIRNACSSRGALI
ncbi:MAG: hypothetical protein OXC91_13830 [Rhodobacteraceae bacterium]|nr:hypothetical protein [Paracoccaceae bacterium]